MIFKKKKKKQQQQQPEEQIREESWSLGTRPPKSRKSCSSDSTSHLVLTLFCHSMIGHIRPSPPLSPSIIGRWKNQRKLQVERKSTAHDHPLIHESMRKGMSQAGTKSWLGSPFLWWPNFAVLWNMFSKKNILSQIPLELARCRILIFVWLSFL